MKKKLVISALLASMIISAGSLLGEREVNASATYGTKRTVSGKTSYSYAWTGSSGKSCKVEMSILDVRAEDTADGWAQTRQLTISGRPTVMATSNHWVNGSYVGYSQN